MSFLDQSELDHYAHIMEMLIHGDPVRKAKLDKATAYAITGIRMLLPDNTDEERAKVMMSIAYLMARLQATPLAGASAYAQEIFEDYVASVAILSGAYNPDPDNLPDLSHVGDEADVPSQFSDDEWEEQLKKSYL